jgi:hypothetical protein
MIWKFVIVLVLALILLARLDDSSPFDYFSDRLVRKSHSPETKARVNAKLEEVEQRLHTFLDRAPKDCPKFRRIRKRWNGKLYETAVEDHPEEALAYSVDKGRAIHICVIDSNGRLANTNAMLFVAIHELAHVAETTYGHGPSFFETMKYLLEVADKVGVYHYQDHNSSFVSVCGRRLGHNPITCVKQKQCKSTL